MKTSRSESKNQVFLVYSMGKVGSTTVYRLFRNQHPKIPIRLVHFLSDFWLNEKLPRLHPFFHKNIKVAKEVLSTLSQLPNHRIKIITLVRDPISREISNFFQNRKGLLGINSPDELTADHVERYLDRHDYEYVLNWFDTEFKEYLGFDIYSVPFDQEKGYSIYKTERADILCVKVENMNGCFETAIKKFADLKMVISESANKSEAKNGKELYKTVVRQYKTSADKLVFIYNSKYVRHFYSEKEIDDFVRKWGRSEMKFQDIEKNKINHAMA